METLYNKEKRLEIVLEKLKTLNSSPISYTGEINEIYEEKNQLQSEKAEIESKYNVLLIKYNDLKIQLKKLENEQKKARFTKPIQPGD